jgi:hypothetical protein
MPGGVVSSKAIRPAGPHVMLKAKAIPASLKRPHQPASGIHMTFGCDTYVGVFVRFQRANNYSFACMYQILQLEEVGYKYSLSLLISEGPGR